MRKIKISTCQGLYSFSNLKGIKIHASFKILKLPSSNLQRMRFLEYESAAFEVESLKGLIESLFTRD